MYFENGLACRIRLRNTEPYGSVSINWGGHPENWRGNDLFSEINLCLSQYHCNYYIKVLMKVGRKSLWPFEVSHGTKKVEKHWSR